MNVERRPPEGEAAAEDMTGRVKHTVPPNTDDAPLTSQERNALLRLSLQRAKLAAADAEARAAELKAEVEARLSKQWDTDDEMWDDAVKLARESVKAANAEIQEKCEALGIPKEGRPEISLGFSRRGEWGRAERRAEIRKTAVAAIDAQKKQVKLQVERNRLTFDTQVLSSVLTSATVAAALAAMPTVEELMPAPSDEALAAIKATKHRSAKYGGDL